MILRMVKTHILLVDHIMNYDTQDSETTFKLKCKDVKVSVLLLVLRVKFILNIFHLLGHHK